MISELHFWHLYCRSEDMTHFKTWSSWSHNCELPNTCYIGQQVPTFRSLFRNFKTSHITARPLWIVFNRSVQRAAISNKLWLTWFGILGPFHPLRLLLYHRKHGSIYVRWFPKRCRSAATRCSPRRTEARVACACSSVHVEPNCREEGTWGGGGAACQGGSDYADSRRVSCRRTKYSSGVTSSPRVPPPTPTKPNPHLSFTDEHRRQMS